MPIRSPVGLTVALIAALIMTIFFLRDKIWHKTQTTPIVKPVASPCNPQAQPAQPPPPMVSLVGKTVVVDAGHGGSDPGAVRDGVKEDDITLAIAMALKADLEARGAKVILTRVDDSDVELEERVAIIEKVSPDVFVSIHINCAPYSQAAQGIETYYRQRRSRLLAHTVHEVLVSRLGVPDRHVHMARFYVIRSGTVPSILAEVGFITNKEERTKLACPAYQKRIADALAEGLISYWERKHLLQVLSSWTKVLPVKEIKKFFAIDPEEIPDLDQ